MKIIVCLKQIIQTYAQTGMDADKYYLAPEDQILRINPYDEAALEIALKQKDADSDTEIILLTLGPVLAEDELRRCLSLGADHLYQIDHASSLDSQQKAEILASVIKTMDPDLILCGRESLDRQNGQVAAFLAGFLNQPFVSAIESLDVSDENKKVIVKRNSGRGARQIIESSMPAVFSVDIGAFEYRMPKADGRKKSDLKPFHQVKGLSDRIVESGIAATSISPPCPRTKTIPVPENDLESFDRIRLLLTGSQTKKKARVLDGSIESQVAGLIMFLKENGFLETTSIEEPS